MKRPHLYIIAPASSDPEVSTKRAIIENHARMRGVQVLFPMDRLAASSGDFLVDKELLELQNSDLVLADLSYQRPSCYYELGLAEAMHRPVEIIARFGTEMHQTSLRSRVQFYNDLDEFTNIVASTLEKLQLAISD